MDRAQDKTAEIEIRLKQISIVPENTCLFFKKDISAVSGLRRCANCVYACFEGNKSAEAPLGFCSFKAGRQATVLRQESGV